MNKSLWLSALLLLALSSCLKSNDDEEQVYYHDTALTSFKLGTLKRILHTTSSSGEDSTYSSTVLGAAYAFTIDQQKGLVYNVDSLPVGTDVSKVIFTASTKNSGSLVLNLRTKDGQRDSLKVYSTTDSIDFTNPVEFRVYNQSGTTYRKYMVEVRAHKQNGNIFRWKQVTLTADEKALLKDLQVKVSEIESMQKTAMESAGQVHLAPDSTKGGSGDSVALLGYRDEWIDFQFNPITDNLHFRTRDSIVAVVKRQYKHRFLWWRWKVKGYEVKLVNFNPYSTIHYNTFIQDK